MCGYLCVGGSGGELAAERQIGQVLQCKDNDDGGGGSGSSSTAEWTESVSDTVESALIAWLEK